MSYDPISTTVVTRERMADAALMSADTLESSSSVDFDEMYESTSEPTDDDDSQVGDDDSDLLEDQTAQERMEKAQMSTDLLISKVTFRRLVMEMLQDIAGGDQLRIRLSNQIYASLCWSLFLMI